MAKSSFLITLALLLWLSSTGFTQWTNRYSKVEGYSHHVYLEGYELPILAAGPTDPAPDPKGSLLAFSARGWIWVLDIELGKARRVTDTSALDSRPTWSPDGTKIAFLRDDTTDIDIWVKDLVTGEESALVDSTAIELDPWYSTDGRFLYYSSSVAGDFDLWRLDLSTGEKSRFTDSAGVERRPMPRDDGKMVVFLDKKRGGRDRIVELDMSSGDERDILTQSIASQTHPGLSPDGRSIVVNWPTPLGYDLLLIDLEGGDPIRLNSGSRLPLAPAFSADGKGVYFSEANDEQEFHLYHVPTVGGDVREVSIYSWDWGSEPARIKIRTDTPARLEIVDSSGHPVVLSEQMPRFDGTHGKVYVYSPGLVEAEVPAGTVSVTATHGFSSEPKTVTVETIGGELTEIDLKLTRLWNPREEGWYSGDHHYHMNYGGPYRLAPKDLVLPAMAEDVDVATPLMANLQHRFNDLEFFRGQQVWHDSPLIVFGQEVRSHFLGHIGIVNIQLPFWPWYWGPGYPVYNRDDRPNVDVLDHARAGGGISSYMHPISVPDPFRDQDSLRSIGISVIPDAVLGDLDALEIACLWTSEIGTSQLWYHFLNVGAPIVASAGTDAMVDFYRTMAVGSTRVYVKIDGQFSQHSYFQALRDGHSFVTTGPLIDFIVDGKLPGEVVSFNGGSVEFSLRLSSSISVNNIEILVNGAVVWSDRSPSGLSENIYQGQLNLPEGGWVAARVYGGVETWPGMNGFPFAHSSPTWVNKVGSIDEMASKNSALELIRALDVAELRFEKGYDGVTTPRLDERFRKAREKLRHLTLEH